MSITMDLRMSCELRLHQSENQRGILADEGKKVYETTKMLAKNSNRNDSLQELPYQREGKKTQTSNMTIGGAEAKARYVATQQRKLAQNPHSRGCPALGLHKAARASKPS